MGSMIFWRLIIVSRQRDCQLNYIFSINNLPSVIFVSTALHILTVYNFTCNYGACFVKTVLFFLNWSLPEK